MVTIKKRMLLLFSIKLLTLLHFFIKQYLEIITLLYKPRSKTQSLRKESKLPTRRNPLKMREQTVRDATLKRHSPSVLYEEEAEKGWERRQGCSRGHAWTRKAWEEQNEQDPLTDRMQIREAGQGIWTSSGNWAKISQENHSTKEKKNSRES